MRQFMSMAVVAAFVGLTTGPSADAQERFAVVTIKNNTKGPMSFYRRWVWNYGTKKAKVHLDWRVTRIPAGRSYTIKYTYQGAQKVSPDLIVVFDSDRNKGAHWMKVKLARAADTDQVGGYVYTLEYDRGSKEYASLVPKNRGRVTVLDRKTSRPSNAKSVPFK